MSGDILQVEGVNSKGFGIIPKMVMQDRRLSSTSKAIYAYFCSYAGAGRTAFPSIGKITSDLGISRGSYYKHFTPLKELGYIAAEQDKDSRGKFVRNLYTLMENLPCTKICDTVATPEPCTKLPHTVKPSTVDCDTAISIKSNSPKNNRATNISQSEPEVDRLLECIKNQIGYSDFQMLYPEDGELVDEIVRIMADVQLGDAPTVRIGRENKPKWAVKRFLDSLYYEHIKYVLERYKARTGRIQNKRQYLLTMLYNSTMELDADVTNQVAIDQQGTKNRLQW